MFFICKLIFLTSMIFTYSIIYIGSDMSEYFNYSYKIVRTSLRPNFYIQRWPDYLRGY